MATSSGVPCPDCGAVTGQKVIDSRATPGGIRRRRQCRCGRRFRTYESTQQPAALIAVKRASFDAARAHRWAAE